MGGIIYVERQAKEPPLPSASVAGRQALSACVCCVWRLHVWMMGVMARVFSYAPQRVSMCVWGSFLLLAFLGAKLSHALLRGSDTC